MPWSPILPPVLPFAGLSVALLVAAWGDLRTRTIPNPLNGGIALAAPLGWWALGLAPWPDMALQVAVALLMFVVFAGFFALGAMGGGDVKLIAAVALWLPFASLLPMLTLMAVLGGVLTIVMLVVHRARRRPGRPEIPYGVAIAGAALWVIANDILTTVLH